MVLMPATGQTAQPPSVDPPTKRTTLAQVAALAGVSVSTASLAFSGSGPVSGATRDKVLAAAEQLNYGGPDPRGRSLRQGRSGIIGVVMEERVLAAFRDPIRIANLDGIARETTADGRGLLLLTDVGESAVAMESASMDGVILMGCSPRSDQSDRPPTPARHPRGRPGRPRLSRGADDLAGRRTGHANLSPGTSRTSGTAQHRSSPSPSTVARTPSAAR